MATALVLTGGPDGALAGIAAPCIAIGLSAVARSTATAMPSAAAKMQPGMRIAYFRFIVGSSSKRGFGDGERAAAPSNVERAHAEEARQLTGWRQHRTRRRCGARRGLRVCGRVRGVEGDVAFDVLLD